MTHKKYYKRVVTKKSLAIAIILVILISFMLAIFETDFKAKLDIKKQRFSTSYCQVTQER